MEKNLQLFEKANITIFKELSIFKKQLKELEEQEKKIKKEIEKSMEKYNITSYKNEYITISRVEPTESKSVDIKKIKETNEKLYQQLEKSYPKITKRAGYVKIIAK